MEVVRKTVGNICPLIMHIKLIPQRREGIRALTSKRTEYASLCFNANGPRTRYVDFVIIIFRF